MAQFLGEFEGKLDLKNRVVLPAAFLKLLPVEANGKWVINKGFEKNLTLYPANEWAQMVEELNKLNLYQKMNRDFLRHFLRGATPVELDSSNRILIPKRLLEHAGMEGETKELIFTGNLKTIEIWSKDAYNAMMDNEPEDFSALAEKVMGGIN